MDGGKTVKHYLNRETNEVYAYAADGSQDAYIKVGLVPISDAELALMRAPTLEEVRSKQISIIESAYTAEKESPITYAGHVFQADAGSVELMTQVASALPAGAGIGWYDIANIEVSLTDVQFAELRGAILMRGQPLFKKRRQLKDAINSAKTVADVEAISW